MAQSGITMQVQNYQKLLDQIEGIQKNGEVAMRRTISDMKSRLPGPIAATVGTVYKVSKAEINPKKAEVQKQAADIRVEGKTVATLALVYEGRVLTPQGHGFTLEETKQKNGRTKINIKIRKQGKQKELKGRYGTAFMARTSEGSSTRIPFQRVPSTGAIEAIRTVAVPEMVDNEEVRGAIAENKKVSNIINTRIEHNFKKVLK